MSTLISAEKISLGYEGERILENLSFSVQDGDYLCIVGENGAGKSTLVKALLSIIYPMEGKIEFAPKIEKTIGYLPQKSYISRSFPTSCAEVVLSGRVASLPKRFFYSKEDKKIAYENMERLGILDLKNKSFSTLSGGQAQRVLIARALSASKKILLLDEPTSSLDPVASGNLYSLFEDLNASGMTMIMVTHDIHVALKSAKHILYLGHMGSVYSEKDEFFSSSVGKRYLEESGHV